MKIRRQYIIVIVALFSTLSLSANTPSDNDQSTPLFIPNLPPWEGSETPPEPISIIKKPPVYLDIDSEGSVYTINAVQDKSGTYEISYKRITEKKLDEIRSENNVDIILQNMEEISLPGESSTTESGSGCPLPNSWSIVAGSDGMPAGFVKVANTNRPPEATTQWIVFDFFTRYYRGRGAHMPIALFHEETMHGWGTFIGDNHGSYRWWDGTYAGCGPDSRFNSQIEGWIQYGTPPQPPSYTWQNTVFEDSCGGEMYDGPVMIVPGFLHVPRYRMEMHSSTGHWVAYRIWEYIKALGDWEVLTEWTARDVDAGNWPFPTRVFNNNAEGIYIFSTPAGNPDPFQIHAYNTQCGWF